MTACLVSVGRIWVEHVASLKGFLFILHAFSNSVPLIEQQIVELLREVELFVEPSLILIDFSIQ